MHTYKVSNLSKGKLVEVARFVADRFRLVVDEINDYVLFETDRGTLKQRWESVGYYPGSDVVVDEV